MKGKFKLLGHIGLALFLVSVLVLALAPVAQAATAVTNVWVEFPYTSAKNATSSTAGEFYVHFKPAVALERGLDYVTVTFPDGTATMGGAGTAYAFTVGSSVAAADLEFSTDYGTSTVSAANWYRSTSNAIVGGYRVKVLVPFDYSAGQDVWLRITSTNITSASTEGTSYKVYVSTTKDTTPVLSSAFTLGDSTCSDLDTTVSPATVGAAAQYLFDATCTVNLTGDTDTVSVMFPVGTVLPSSISASNVQFSDDSTDYTASSSTPTVDTDKRIVTATVSTDVTAASETLYMKILSGAGITNPTRASTDDYYCMLLTSQDGKWVLADAVHTISGGTATKVAVCNGEVGLASTYYSDDATMINMLSSYIYVTLTDDYGNAKAPSSSVTVTPSSSSASGTFYVNSNATPGSGTYSSATSITVSTASPATAAQQVFYKDTAAGTYTLTFSATGYTSATWTMKVAPAVSLYDASNNLVNTYAATSTSPVAEIAAASGTGATQKYASDYINSAIDAAIQGDTVKLGDGIYEVDSDSYINVNEKITLTSVNGASATTIRNTAEIDKALEVSTDGSAATPIIIEKLTFQRLRAGGSTDIDMAIRNAGNDYVTVRNCIFNNIEPDYASDQEGVVWFTNTDTITSATVSNNTFSSCVTTWPDMGSGTKSGCIIFDGQAYGGTAKMSGITISGNTLTSCGQYGITIGGYGTTNTATGTISNNTITDGYSSITISDYIGAAGLSIIGNTITGAYSHAIKVEGSSQGPITIKKNTITGCAGTSESYAIRIERQPLSSISGNIHLVQYNDIYNNAGYAIKVDSTDTIALTEIDCRYNNYGDATGPSYTALTGATVTKSNPNGTGDTITDRVFYYPWLWKSLANVVADNASYQASTMKLVAGWDTLSTPVKLTSTADSIDELIPSGMTIGYYYDNGWQQITTGYVLNPCNAVYVKMSAEKYVLLKFDASAFTTPSKSLNAGWNLMSMAALDSDGKYDKQVVASVASTAAGLPGYSQVVSPSINATQTDMYGNTGTSWTYSYGETTTAGTNYMYAGLGYWCYMQMQLPWRDLKSRR